MGLLKVSLAWLFTTLVLVAPAFAAGMLDDNNAVRAQYGKPPMQLDSRLQAAAQDHANFMAASRSMDHYSNGGYQARAARHGFRGGVTENIAMGAANPWSLWVNSPGHFRSIVGNYNACGIAVAYSGSTPYWCAVYGNVVAVQPPRDPQPTINEAYSRQSLMEVFTAYHREKLQLQSQPQYQAYQPVPQYQPQPAYQSAQYAFGGCSGRRCRRR